MDFRFYHLEYNPFVTQPADHLFWNAMYQRAWDALHERINERLGVIGLLGETGLGKTALLQTYRSSADPKYVHVIDGIDAAQPPSALLASLVRACGLTASENEPEALFNAFYRHCYTAHACGRQVVWMIDDAHALSIQTLEYLHGLFERLHREDEPIIQLVLSGRPTLQSRGQHPDLYRFEKALSNALVLSPLRMEDRVAYIHHYLKAASTQTTRIFTKRALNLIVEHSNGIPKVINITCTDVLVAGLMAAENPISIATVKTVLHDEKWRLPPMVQWGMVSAAGLLLAAGIWGSLPEAPLVEPPRSASTPMVQAPSSSVSTPAVQMAAPPSLTTARRPVRAAKPESKTPARPPVATPREAEKKSREIREQQVVKTALAKTEAIDRDQNRINLAKLVVPQRHLEPSALDRTKPPVMPKPNPTDSARTTASDFHPPIEPVTRQEPRRNAHPVAQPPKPSIQRSALVASASARLLCAMPRTGGRQGSDIVLLGSRRRPVHRLIEDGSQNMSPVLSPDGTRLAYTSYRGGKPNIYLRDLSSGQETQLTTGPRLALPGTWSPNGRYLSLSQNVNGNNDIYIYDVAQKRLRRLTQNNGIDVSPSFAPDGQRLVFSSDRTGSPQLYITDITGLPPIRLTRSGSYNTSPSWSPQGDTIAFIGRGQNRSLDLYIIKPDGSKRQRLTEGQRFHTPPAWLPDGRTLMGMSLRGSVWERHLMQLDANEPVPSLPRPDSLCLAPQWVAYRVP